MAQRKSVDSRMEGPDEILSSISELERKVEDNRLLIEKTNTLIEGVSDRLGAFEKDVVRLAIDDRRWAIDDMEERGTTLFMQIALQLGFVFTSISVALYALSFTLPESHFGLISGLYLVGGLICLVISAVTARKQSKDFQKKLEHLRDLLSKMEKKEGPLTDPVSVLTSLRP